MKRLYLIALPLSLTLAACGEDPIVNDPPPEETNQERICADYADQVGSAPATAASFELDCTLGTDQTAYRYECARLEMRIELADGTVLDLAGLDEVGLYISTDYQPRPEREQQVVLQLSAEEARLSDGRRPYFDIWVPHSLFTAGTIPVGGSTDECLNDDTCAMVLLGASGPEHLSSYELETHEAFDIQAAEAGFQPGDRFVLSATVPAGLAEVYAGQAVCDDGLIHYAP